MSIKRYHPWVVSAVVLLFIACDGGSPRVLPPPPSPANPVQIGQDEFVTVEPGSGTYGYNFSGGADAGVLASAGPTADSAEGRGAAPSGRYGTVEEADIYRVDGNRLFYLNTYKGFLVYDLDDPSNPQRVSRLPVHGYPIEMFVTPTTVYALLRDALYLSQDANGLTFKRHNVSQLVSIDITDIRNPKVLKTVDIIGELREGVSRKIDDTLYVVSYLPQSYYWAGYPYSETRTEQAWVYSFNVADPSDLRLVDSLKIFEGGGYSSYSSTASSSRWFGGVAISATANTLHVVENWHVYGSVDSSSYRCGSWMSQQEAVISIVDISDPTGQIRLHSRFQTSGSLNDQFKQTYVFDEAAQKGYYLGIFARREWSSTDIPDGGCMVTSLVQNNLEAWDVTDGPNPVRVGRLPFGKPDETVRGTTFDVSRKVAFAITAQAIDPLYAISFADPANLRVLSEIDGLSGDMNVFRLIGENKFLIAIGRDNSSTCTGFADPNTGWATNVAVSIIDVQDLARIRLVQRKCVTVKNAEWIWSEINWNLDQAHKMIGMHSDGRANVISVPVHYYSRVSSPDGAAWWWYRPQSAVGLMSWDLSRYDPAQSELNQSVLQNWGTVLHPHGAVRRSVVFTHQGVTARRMMVNLSDTHVSVVDIDDLATPAHKAEIEVAPYHGRIYRFGDHVVDEVRLGGEYDWQPGASEFRVKPAAPGADEGTPVATFTVSRVERVVQWKNFLAVFRSVPQSSDAAWWSRETELVLFDLSDPTKPTRRGSVKAQVNATSYVFYGCGVDAWGWWPTYGGGNSFAVSSEGVALLGNQYTAGDQYSGGTNTQLLVFFHLANPDAPVAESRALAMSTWSSPPVRQYFGLVSAGENGPGVFATYRESVGTLPQGDQLFTQYKYYAERWSHSSGALAVDFAVNTPGQAIRTWEKNGAELFLSTDNRYVEALSSGYRYWQAEPRLHLLEKRDDRAVVTDTLDLAGYQLGDIVGDSERLFLRLPPTYSYSSTSEVPSDTLTILDVSESKLTRRFSGAIGTYATRLMGAVGQRLFLNLTGDGILVLDVSDLDHPQGQHFARTLGWASHIAFGGDIAFVAAGNFGIYEIDLTAPPTVPRL